MINTSCSGCVFENFDNKQCFFDIPEIISSIKKTELRNNSIYIEDYICKYGISKKVYDEHEQLKNINITQFVIDQAKINYYLVINMEYYQDNIDKLCEIINNLDIKPKYISFINKNLKQGKEISEKIQNLISNELKWKLHNFVVDICLQDCATVSMDTNINKVSGGIFLIHDPSENNALDTEILNNRINFIHMECVVKQNKFHVIMSDKSSLDGLSMSFVLYKNLMSNMDPNIIEAINKDKEIVSIFYE